MSVELYPHNQKTYENIITMWETENRVAAVQPTGSGKSFLILKCAEKFNDLKKVVLSPSIHIFDEIKKNLGDIENIEFITYAKLQFMTDEEIKLLDVEFIALDEIHRCGAEQWGTGVQRLLDLYPNAKVLGTSATPIRFLDNARDMSDELFNNNIACNMTLPQAIVEGILPMPKYVSALYTFDEEAENMIDKVNKSKNSEEEKINLIGDINKLKTKLDRSKGIPKILSKHIDKPNGRYLVFCKSKEHMNEMKTFVSGWFKKYFKTSKLDYSVTCYEVYSELQDSDEQLKMFVEDKEEDTVKLLFCINMLNEGLHINNLDGVILLRPTTSPTMYYQQIGRSIDAGRKEEQTLILDLVNNFSNIRINTFKEDLEKISVEYCNRNNIRLTDKKEFIGKFKVIDETSNAVNLFNEINSKLYCNWDLYVKALNQFKNREGHCNILQSHIEYVDGNKIYIGSFCNNIRMNRDYIITDEKFSQLKEVGFVFDKKIKGFDFWYNLCIEVKNETGNCNIPKREKYKKLNLGTWQQSIRIKYMNNKLTNYQIDRLKQIGFIFNCLENDWSVMYSKLFSYYKKNGHSNVAKGHISNEIALARWVGTQRTIYKNNKLTEDRINKLLKLDFKFIIGTTKMIVCLENKYVFNTVGAAAEWCNLKFYNSISSNLTNKQKSAGKHPETGEPLHWMYYDEYVKLYGEVDTIKE